MIERHYIDDTLVQMRKLKIQAEKAVEQMDDAQLVALIDPDANSVALIMKHLAGNMRSRWTDFLTSDGEKPDRDRDSEFEPGDDDSRHRLMAAWEDGWARVFAAIGALSDGDLSRTVTVRGESLTVVEAINRQVTHYAAHVGQIVLLAKHYAGPQWRTLTIPKRKSNDAGRR